MTRLGFLVIIAILIGVVDCVGLYAEWVSTHSALEAWAFTHMALWVAVVGFGLYRFGPRSLWSLFGLPLVLFPYAVMIMGAGKI